MKTKPIKRYRRPAYPTRKEVALRPSLLQQHQPSAWRQAPGMAGAVALFLAANTSINAQDKKNDNLPKAAAVVAPIFAHGEGRGATGCVVVAPPVFLSEEEALKVIEQEMTQQGLAFTAKEVEIQGIKFAPRHMMAKEDPSQPGKFRIEVGDDHKNAIPFKADRIDPKKKVGFEFVAEKDYFALGGEQSMSSVQAYELKETAQKLATTMQKQAGDKIHFGVFYDPIIKMGFDRQKDEPVRFDAGQRERCKAEAQRLLRLQVQDFVKWLQGQGVI